MNNKQKNKQNIVLHDIFDIRGGGERLALSLTKGLDADLCYGKHSSNSFELEKYFANQSYDLGLKLEILGLKTWSLSKLFRNKTQFLENYDNVVYSGIICPLAISNHQNGGNYYYCHTPPRFVYDKYEHYLNKFSFVQAMLLRMLVAWYRPQYEQSVALMDVVIANSNFVKARIKKHLNRDAIVVYPPCDTEKFSYKESQGYYLSTARFDPLKRVDKVIEAFKQMPKKKLVVCSTGSEKKSLKNLAQGADNISFTGAVSDKKLTQLISECIATIYIPTDEDFGMSPVESMAAGKPVICSGHGGPTESVVDYETGFYINEDNINGSLIEIVNKLDVDRAKSMQKACENQAKKFSEKKFHQKMNQIVLD